MKKKIILFLTILSVSFMLCACGKEDKGLTIYVVETDALLKTATEAFQNEHPEEQLQVVSFASYDEMWELLSTELMGGKGPDVLLFNSLYSKADPYKLVVSDALLSLQEQVDNLSADKYFGDILDSGVINGKQYLLPLSWNFIQAYSSQDKVNERGYTQDIYAAMLAESKALETDDTCAISSVQLGRADIMNCYMEIAGNELINMERGELVDRKEELKETADYVRVLYDNLEKMQTITTRYRNDFAGAVSHFTYLVENYPFMNNLRYYQTVYPMYVNEEMYFATFPRRDDGKITAQVMQYGAINVHTKNTEGAWKLLQYIMDTPVSMEFSKYESQTIYYAPVNTKVYEACVEELATTSGQGPGKKVSPLNEEWAEVLRSIPSQIGGAVIPNAALGELIQECMEPYLLRKESYDDCYEKLMQRAKLYLNE